MAYWVKLVPSLQSCQRFGRQVAATITTLPLKDEHLFTNEHHEMRQSLKKLIDKDINPYVDEWEKQQMFPAHKVFKNLGDNGFLGVNYSTEYGGLGLPYSFNIAIAEEIGSIHCHGIPLAFGVQTDMATPALALFGSDELCKKFLTPTIAGDMVACVGVSEAGAGSDVASIKTTAIPKRGTDDYIINGSKMWTTSGLQADWMCLLANTSEGTPHRNKSLICLPMDASGITKTKIHNKLGMASSDTAQIFFDNVVVPKKYLIGEEGKGFTYQMIQFQRERLWSSASGGDCQIVTCKVNYLSFGEQSTSSNIVASDDVLVTMERMVQQTIDYTRERKAFGKSILDNQYVHFRLAEMESEVEALRSLIYRATALLMEGHDVTKLASMAKLKAGRLVREVADGCLQFWGGMGYTEEVEISRVYRDTRLVSIGAGADEVMLGIICKLSGTLPSS